MLDILPTQLSAYPKSLFVVLFFSWRVMKIICHRTLFLLQCDGKALVFFLFTHISVVGMYVLYVFPLVLLFLRVMSFPVLRRGHYQLDHLTACFNSFWSV